MRGLSLLCVVGSIAVVAGTTASALAQAGSGGTITDGDCTFTQVVSPTSGTATPATGSVFRVNGAGGTDHTFYDWWWFRVNGVDTREFAFNSATSWNWAGRSGTVNYTTANFTAVLSWTITDTGTNSGQIDTSARITNTTAAPLNLALFHGFDMDYAGSIGTDGVVLTSPGLMTLTDTVAAAPWNATPAFYAATSPDAYAVAPFGNALAPRTLLVDANINNWTNTGLPFAPADFTGSWQFNRTVPVGGDIIVTASYGIGTYVPPGGTVCPADLDNDGNFANGGAPDGAITIDDLLYFLVGFEGGSTAVDLDNDGDPAVGTPDGAVTVDDLLFFLVRFENGC